MGSSHSSNVASAVANVSNMVQNSTTANQAQVQNINQKVILDNCSIKLAGDFNDASTATTLQKNNQIVSAIQDANVSNNIQQKMLQEAASTVGALGVGYATAHNASSELINATTSIIDAMQSASAQFSTTNQSFNCDNSTIIANNLNIDFATTSDFMSSQTLNNSQTADIVNNVSQTVDQKATATVEGLTAIIFMILLCIVAIVWILMKPLSTGAAKVAVGGILAVAVLALIAFMFIKQTPPFFQEASECINGSSQGCDGAQCVDQSSNNINLKAPPTRYMYPILPAGSPSNIGNMIQIAIASASATDGNNNGDNGGYRADVMDKLESQITNLASYAQLLGIPNIPNPLYLYPDGKSMYAVPTQYSLSTSTSDPQASICTPGILQIDNNSTFNLSNCGKPVNANLLTPTSTSSSAVANLNLPDWNDYLNLGGKYPPTPGFTNSDKQTEQTTRALFARFALSSIIGNIDLHIYLYPSELVQYKDGGNTSVVSQASQAPQDAVYLFNITNSTFDPTFINGLTSSGQLAGAVGKCSTNTYKFQKFMQGGGKIITYIILALVFTFIFGSAVRSFTGGSK